MIFAFVEDGTLQVYETAHEAIRAYEGIDVESGVVRFYYESGGYLEPRFFGQLQLNDGHELVQFGHGWVHLWGTVRASSIEGYDLEWEGTLSSGCDLTPVAATTWGQIKSHYR